MFYFSQNTNIFFSFVAFSCFFTFKIQLIVLYVNYFWTFYFFCLTFVSFVSHLCLISMYYQLDKTKKYGGLRFERKKAEPKFPVLPTCSYS